MNAKLKSRNLKKDRRWSQRLSALRLYQMQPDRLIVTRLGARDGNTIVGVSLYGTRCTLIQHGE